MPSSSRFVILEHDHPILHWDFMLDIGGVLRSWRLSATPCTGEMIAEQLADHRQAYLDYEGPVSGDRGAVKRWDRGTYRLEADASDSLDMDIVGEKIQGRVRMTRVAATSWRVTWILDRLTTPPAPPRVPS